MMRKLILLGLFIVMIPFALSAQNIRVSGVVLDADNEPLPGVNVIETGTTNGTITDIDGKYELSLPSDATITFSYIGFTNHVEASTDAHLFLQLHFSRTIRRSTK
jgi:hypothetical protein